jgi:hypothetical protein
VLRRKCGWFRSQAGELYVLRASVPWEEMSNLCAKRQIFLNKVRLSAGWWKGCGINLMLCCIYDSIVQQYATL